MIPELPPDLSNLLTCTLPFISSLGKCAANRVVETISKKLGETIADTALEPAKRIFQRLLPHVETHPELQIALADCTSSPEEQDFQAVLRVQLRKLLVDNPDLQRDLGNMLSSFPCKQENKVTASGNGAVAVGGSINGSIITTKK